MPSLNSALSRKLITVASFALLAAGFLPLSALAQVTGANLQTTGVQVSSGNLLDLIALVVRIASSIAGIIAFVYVLYAGFAYILSGGDAAKASKATAMIINAVIGIIIIALSYSIISFTISRIGSQSLPTATTPAAPVPAVPNPVPIPVVPQ